jgi:hypothetical protein
MSHGSPLANVASMLSSDDREMLSLRRFILAAMNQIGGPERLAELFVAGLTEGGPGSPGRSQSLQLALRLLERYGTDADDDLLEPEDVEAQLRATIRAEFEENADFRQAVLEAVLGDENLRGQLVARLGGEGGAS